MPRKRAASDLPAVDPAALPVLIVEVPEPDVDGDGPAEVGVVLNGTSIVFEVG